MHIVILFAPEDRAARDEIEKRLKPLSLRIWDTTKIDVGDDMEAAYNEQYQTADVALVLVSAELISNDALMELAGRLREQRTTRVIPILLRKCFWEETVLGGLEMLPRNGEPIIQGSNPQDERFFQVVSEIRTWIVGGSDSNTGLPPLPKDILPPKDPYLELAWFKRADARIFFGRGEAIKTLIDLVKQNDAQVILLYGQSGVGKSSLLDAGLRPRLEAEYYIPDSYREEKPDLMGAHLEALTAISRQPGKCLLILDQLEEMIVNPNPAQPGRPLQFTQLLKTAIKNNPEQRILLGFRKEYLAEISTWLEDNNIYFLTYFLQPLKYDEVLDAITGVTKEKALKLKYKLEIDPEVTLSLAKDILHDKESHIAPFLQITLRKMWDAVAKQDAPVFNVPLYERFRSDSFEMLLTTQLAELEIQFPAAVKSGLVYDILRFFTTEQETAAPQSIDEVEKNFGLVYNIREILEAMKRLFLLADTSKSKYYRLAHDALAPLVVRFYNNSDAPGQRATRFLETALRTKTRLSKEAVFAVQDGVIGRRNLSDGEQEKLREGMHRYRKDYVKLLIRNNKLEEAIRMLQSHFEEHRQQELLDETLIWAYQNRELIRLIQMGLTNSEDVMDLNTQVRENLLNLTDAIFIADASFTRININKALSAGEIDQALNILMQFAEDSENEPLANQGNKLSAEFAEYQTNFKTGIMLAGTFLEGSLRVADALLAVTDNIFKITTTESKVSPLRQNQLNLLKEYYNLWKNGAAQFQLDFSSIEPFYPEGAKSTVFDTLCLASCRKAIIEKKFLENEISESEFQQNLSRIRFSLIDLYEDFFAEEALPSGWEDLAIAARVSSIKSCVADDNIKGALTRLQSSIAKIPSDSINDRFATICKLYQHTKDHFRKGTIDQNNYRFNLSQINFEILRFCEELLPSERHEISETDTQVKEAKDVVARIDQVDLFNFFLPLNVLAGHQKKWLIAREIAYLFTQYIAHPPELTQEENKLRIEKLRPKLNELCLFLNDIQQHDISATHAPPDQELIRQLVAAGYTEFALCFVRNLALEHPKTIVLEELDILERKFYAAKKRFHQGIMLFNLYQVTVQKTVTALLEIADDYFCDTKITDEAIVELPNQFPLTLYQLLEDGRIEEAIKSIYLFVRQSGVQQEAVTMITEWQDKLIEMKRRKRLSDSNFSDLIDQQLELVNIILVFCQKNFAPIFEQHLSEPDKIDKKETLKTIRFLISEARIEELISILRDPRFFPGSLSLYNSRVLLSFEYFELKRQNNQGLILANDYLLQKRGLVIRLQDYCRRAYA